MAGGTRQQRRRGTGNHDFSEKIAVLQVGASSFKTAQHNSP
jgi:hypothetical protein